MWQRFTEQARRVVFFAQEEAQKFGEGYVSTEHLLLGLVREGNTVSSRALERLGLPRERIRLEVEKQLPRGPRQASEEMTLTPRAKRVIDLAYDEARNLNNNYIGTEHLLLGLIREGDGLGGRVLAKLGLELEAARRVVAACREDPVLGQEQPQPPKPPARNQSTKQAMPRTAMLLMELLANRQGRYRVDRLCALLLAEENGPAGGLLQAMGHSPAYVLTLIEMELLRQVATADPPGHQATITAVLDLANEEAAALSQRVDTAHILIAALRIGDSLTATALAELRLTVEGMRDALCAPNVP